MNQDKSDTFSFRLKSLVMTPSLGLHSDLLFILFFSKLLSIHLEEALYPLETEIYYRIFLISASAISIMTSLSNLVCQNFSL